MKERKEYNRGVPRDLQILLLLSFEDEVEGQGVGSATITEAIGLMEAHWMGSEEMADQKAAICRLRSKGLIEMTSVGHGLPAVYSLSEAGRMTLESMLDFIDDLKSWKPADGFISNISGGSHG